MAGSALRRLMAEYKRKNNLLYYCIRIIIIHYLDPEPSFLN